MKVMNVTTKKETECMNLRPRACRGTETASSLVGGHASLNQLLEEGRLSRGTGGGAAVDVFLVPHSRWKSSIF